jgi:hypothetical protein
MARKQAIVAAGMFETERVRAHDFHLWLRMAKRGARIGYQKKPLLKYRVHLNSLSGDSVSRVIRERDAFERVSRTIDLDEEQSSIVKRRIEGLEADLAVERGKALLLDGDHSEAAAAFRAANEHRRSLKLAGIALLANIAPKLLVRLFRSRRAGELALIPTGDSLRYPYKK